MSQSPAHTVLVVEDDDKLRELIRDVLTLEQCRVLAARDGTHAVYLLDRLQPPRDQVCVVLLDMMLPGVSGLDVLRHIRADPDPVPVVAVSASDALLLDARRAGAVTTVAKPFDIDELLTLVEEHCPHQPH